MQRSLLLTPPLNLFRSPSIRHSSSRSTPTPSSSTPDEAPSPAPSASSYLAQQALLEEEELAETVRKNKRLPPELREPVWEGEETREAMLKRILEDQYKPLRVKGYQKPIPKPSPLPSALFASPSSSSSTSTSPPSSSEPKQPWEYDTSFKSPQHYNPAPGFRSSSLILNPSNLGPGGRHQGRTQIIAKKMVGGDDSTSQKKKKETLSKLRVFSAYERTLDYKSGNRSTGGGGGVGISLPIEEELDEFGGGGGDEGAEMAGQMRVWEGFIEEKIKKARKQGLFRNVQGRGKPLPKDEAEGNPFISRNDFLINRIMKTQDAAPPWIELQKELESTLISFRQNLSSSWIRRAIRIRSSEGLTPAVVREIENGWRDPEWEKKEERYQTAGITELNDAIRRYNIIAPYNVRRPLLTLESERKRTISLSSSHIATELRRRLSLGLNSTPTTYVDSPDLDDEGVRNLTADEMGGEKKEVKESMWKAFRRVLVEVLGKGPDEMPAMRRVGKRERVE